MKKFFPSLSYVILALALITVTPSGLGQGCNCGAEYTMVNDEGHIRSIGSVALTGGTSDYYYNAYDYLDAYSHLYDMQNSGFQVNIFIQPSSCYNWQGARCFEQN